MCDPNKSIIFFLVLFFLLLFLFLLNTLLINTSHSLTHSLFAQHLSLTHSLQLSLTHSLFAQHLFSTRPSLHPYLLTSFVLQLPFTHTLSFLLPSSRLSSADMLTSMFKNTSPLHFHYFQGFCSSDASFQGCFYGFNDK